MESISVAPFCYKDTEKLIALWNRCLPIDGITLDIFERKILLDPNFDIDGLQVAKTESGQLVGFMYGVVFRVPLEGAGMLEDLGWITAAGVDPDFRHRGIGLKLWTAVESFFKARNRKIIAIATYAPNYFVPGIDIHAYPEAVQFFEKVGFKITARPLSMDAHIWQFTIPEKILETEKRLLQEGIRIQKYERKYLIPYLEFMRKDMPGNWIRIARENLTLLTYGRFKEEQIFLAIKGDDEIIGYCQYEEEHFGPFGVSDRYQGKGIGQVLLARTIEQMRNRGHHNAWLLWTDDKASVVYSKVGFKESRRYVVMKKEL
ncbi:MAG: GNAT family N-acetyltransferase [bacterium]|nr:GNAT family N-acetyltransferase [bacterium]